MHFSFFFSSLLLLLLLLLRARTRARQHKRSFVLSARFCTPSFSANRRQRARALLANDGDDQRL